MALMRTLVVNNIPSNLDEATIKDVFSDFGKVLKLSLQPIGNTQACRIVYDNEDDAKKAHLSMNDFEIETDYVLRTVIVVDVDESAYTLSDAMTDDISQVSKPQPPSPYQYTQPTILDSKEDEILRTVYVGNIASGITVDDLKVFFSTCGEVLCARINDVASRFGFLEFESVESAHRAFQVNGLLLANVPVVVKSSNNAIVKSSQEQSAISHRLKAIRKGAPKMAPKKQKVEEDSDLDETELNRLKEQLEKAVYVVEGKMKKSMRDLYREEEDCLNREYDERVRKLESERDVRDRSRDRDRRDIRPSNSRDSKHIRDSSRERYDRDREYRYR